jgi:hypothetical protein
MLVCIYLISDTVASVSVCIFETCPWPCNITEDQYSQGRLVMGGGFLPNPSIELISADGAVRIALDVVLNER